MPIDSTVNFLVGAGECVCCPGDGGAEEDGRPGV